MRPWAREWLLWCDAPGRNRRRDRASSLRGALRRSDGHADPRRSTSRRDARRDGPRRRSPPQPPPLIGRCDQPGHTGQDERNHTGYTSPLDPIAASARGRRFAGPRAPRQRPKPDQTPSPDVGETQRFPQATRAQSLVALTGRPATRAAEAVARAPVRRRTDHRREEIAHAPLAPPRLGAVLVAVAVRDQRAFPFTPKHPRERSADGLEARRRAQRWLRLSRSSAPRVRVSCLLLRHGS